MIKKSGKWCCMETMHILNLWNQNTHEYFKNQAYAKRSRQLEVYKEPSKVPWNNQQCVFIEWMTAVSIWRISLSPVSWTFHSSQVFFQPPPHDISAKWDIFLSLYQHFIWLFRVHIFSEISRSWNILFLLFPTLTHFYILK